jgi:hypothetical protein
MFFVDSEVDGILAVRQQREKQAREDYFAYFSELALDYYGNLIAEKRGQILQDMLNAAMRLPFLSTIKVPLHTVWTYEATSPMNREARRLYENQHYNTGSWFHSLSGLNRANIYAIFMHSDFRQKMDARLGRGMFLTMTSKRVRTSNLGVKEYEVTLWMNLAVSRR